MDCIEFNELIFSYIDGELNDSQNELFENHMKKCPSCHKEYQANAKLLSDIHALPMEELPKGYCKRLHVRLDDAKVSSKKIKRNNFIKYIGIAASCILVITAIYVIGVNSNNDKNYTNDIAMDNMVNGTTIEYTAGKDNYNFNKEEAKPEEAPAESANEETSNDTYEISSNINTRSSLNLSQESKIIKAGQLSLETLNFDEFMSNLDEVVRQNNGYFEYNQTSISYRNEDKDYKNASVKLRVPQESFYNIISFIEEQTDVYNREVNEYDVTKDYYDMENTLINFQVQENRLRELYDKAANVTEILQLENEIRRIRTEIDSYGIKLSDIDDRVNMATISLSITEIEGRNINISTSKSLWDKSKEGFIRTINYIIEGIEGIIVWIISYLPIIIPIVIIGAGVFIIARKKIKK